MLCLPYTPDQIVGISVVVLVLLFVGQFHGTSLVGQAFAPIVIIWLAMNASVGIHNLAMHGGEICASLNPWQIVLFFAENGRRGWLMLGGVILCITGAEAMYSDLGHFTRLAVSVSVAGWASGFCVCCRRTSQCCLLCSLP